MIDRNIDNVSVAKSSFATGSFDISPPDGYKVVGIVGHHGMNASSGGTGVSWLMDYSLYLSSSTNKVYYEVRNLYTSAAIKVKIGVAILLVRKEFYN